MDYKKKFSKKALKDFKLIDLAINKNDQKAYSEIMKSYKNSIYFTILKSKFVSISKDFSGFILKKPVFLFIKLLILSGSNFFSLIM